LLPDGSLIYLCTFCVLSIDVEGVVTWFGWEQPADTKRAQIVARTIKIKSIRQNNFFI
jgi:hypothetical protein